MQLPSPNDDYFQLARAPRALRAAVEQLSLEIDRPLAEMESLTMGDILRLAQEHYHDLPFFWRNWLEWSRAEGPQPMGEL